MEKRLYLKHWKNTNLYYMEVYAPAGWLIGQGFVSRTSFLDAAQHARLTSNSQQSLEMEAHTTQLPIALSRSMPTRPVAVPLAA